MDPKDTERQDRKNPRLDHFDYSENRCYFVTLCTHNRQTLFDIERASPSQARPCGSFVGAGLRAGLRAGPRPPASPRSPQNALIHKWLHRAQEQFPTISIKQYVIMPDHLHLMVTITEKSDHCSLPEIMRFFKAATTNEYIRSVKGGILPPFDKKLRQRSYYDHIIRNQQDHDNVWEYIENNPEKWMWIHGLHRY